jgi:hypothetical protein
MLRQIKSEFWIILKIRKKRAENEIGKEGYEEIWKWGRARNGRGW